jgi:membrane protease YdiL (CAAX protease family)
VAEFSTFRIDRNGPPREQLWEFLVFLFLIAPSMGLSFFLVRNGAITFVLAALSTIFRDLALVSLVAFFLWRNGEPRQRIGWNFHNKWSDAALGAALFVPVASAISLLDKLLRRMGLSNPATPLPKFLSAKGSAEVVLAALLVVVVAISEEVIFRGYLILRLSTITRSTATAVLLSSVIFSLGHGYEGAAGVVSVGVMGLVFALVYLWRESLLAPILMHLLQDFAGIVLPALLHHK